MAKLVHEIMNPEVFSVRADDATDLAMLGVLALGITTAPVVDADGQPIGVISLRDLVGALGGARVRERMRIPAATIRTSASVQDAARALDQANLHHLVAVDRQGRAAGMVSSLDVVRALTGAPVRHPDAFPHRDAAGVTWSDPEPMDLEHSAAAPDGPGLLVLVHGEALRPEIPVWAEAAPNVRTRIHQMLSLPQSDQPSLARLLERDGSHLRFRAAAIRSDEAREAALRRAESEVASASGLPRPARGSRRG